MEKRPAKRVAKLHDNSLENEEEAEVDKSGGDDKTIENEHSDIDKFPNEILMKILDYLNENELVKCRLLNSRWNEISCLLLPEKTKRNRYSKLIVQLSKPRGVNSFNCTTVNKRAFDTFLKFFSPFASDGQSHRPIPFSRFFVKDFYHLNESQIIRFVSTFGPHIKFLTVDVKKQDCENFEKFWKLLLKFAPNIQHLGIGGDKWLNKLNLFYSNSNPTENVNVKETADSFLQNLKSIEFIKDHVFGSCDGFIKKLLNHAPNVKEVLSYSGYYVCNSNELDVLEVCQRLEKPHLLKKLVISYLFKEYSPPAQLMKNLGLESLYANSYGYSSSLELSTFNYIHHALKSSQNTLSSLNLRHLTIESMNHCFNDISPLPNVLHLKIQIQNAMETANILEKVSQLCPNLSSLKLDRLHGDDSNSDVAKILWTKFQGLKCLKFKLYMTDENNTLIVVDSAISGYSRESIQKIKEKLDEGISLEEARRNEQQNTSILDLKGLTRLELEFGMGKRTNRAKKVENELWNSVFIKILPQYFRENPRLIMCRYS